MTLGEHVVVGRAEEGGLSRRLGQDLGSLWNLGRDPWPCVCMSA